MPPDFEISDRVARWAAEKDHTRLAEHLESFKSKVRAKGYRYVDWDEAFMNAIRGDWAQLRAERRPQDPAPIGGQSRRTKEDALAPAESRLSAQLRWLNQELTAGRMTPEEHEQRVAEARSKLKDAA